MYNYKAKISNVVDGDTFDLDIDLGFNIHIHERVRLLGVDCPEKTARNGEEEKIAGLLITSWANRNLLDKNVIIESFKGTDSFGRWLVNMKVDFHDRGNYEDLKTFYDANGYNKLDENYNLNNLLIYAGDDRRIN